MILNLDEGVNEKELLIHYRYCEDSTLTNLLSSFDYPKILVSIWILRKVEHISYEEKIEQQIKTQIENKSEGDLAALLRGN